MTEKAGNRVGLIGWPVEHSVSPSMHNAAFGELGLDWDYELLPTPPGSVEARLRTLEEDGTEESQGILELVRGEGFEPVEGESKEQEEKIETVEEDDLIEVRKL